MDAHQRGYKVLLARECCGDDDPLHGEISRIWMNERGMQSILFNKIGKLLSYNANSNPNSSDAFKTVCDNDQFSLDCASSLVSVAKVEQLKWSLITNDCKRNYFNRFISSLHDKKLELAMGIAEEVGKPISAAIDEVDFSIRLVKATVSRLKASTESPTSTEWHVERLPVGVVAVITPWNNPLSIPIGKICSALHYGNAIVWKPALKAVSSAEKCLKLLHDSGFPKELIQLIKGNDDSARILMECKDISCITVTGGPSAGLAAQISSCRGQKKLQAELGGNNSTIVWKDADLTLAAKEISIGAFGFAGQRCTATRRVILPAEHAQQFKELLMCECSRLNFGDPMDLSTMVGPVISPDSFERLESLLSRAEKNGCQVTRIPMRTITYQSKKKKPLFYPAIVEGADPMSEIVQEESFGPILVIQIARDWKHALELSNNVKQGLVSSIFTNDLNLWDFFKLNSDSGIVKLNTATAGVSPEAPFVGWKNSGIGAAEHCQSEIDLYTKIRTIYS